MHDTRDSVHFAHHLDARSVIRLEHGLVILFLVCLVAAAFAFPYI
jgi:hypothetical protein